MTLRSSLVPEVLLHRPFCVLEVERHAAPTGVPRTGAWHAFDSVLKHRAESYVSGSTMSKFVADSFNVLSKFEANAVKKRPAPKN